VIDPHSLHMVTAMLTILMIPLLIMIVVVLIPYWVIWKKAGFAGWLSLFMLIPLLNIIMMYVLAFSDWKVVPVAQMQEPGMPPRV
jgi:hypothetical protein